MVNGGDGAQQSAIIEQLIRLEAGVAALNQRVTDNHNLLLEAIRQMNELLDETNRLIDETTQATNTRLDNQLGELRRELRSEFNKLTYLILGTGAAIIAAMVATQLFT